MTQPNDTQAWLSINDAAEQLGVHPRTLRRYIRDGKLTALRLSAQIVRIRNDDIDDFLRKNLKVVTGTGTCYVPTPEKLLAKPVEDWHGKVTTNKG